MWGVQNPISTLRDPLLFSALFSDPRAGTLGHPLELQSLHPAVGPHNGASSSPFLLFIVIGTICKLIPRWANRGGFSLSPLGVSLPSVPNYPPLRVCRVCVGFQSEKASPISSGSTFFPSSTLLVACAAASQILRVSRSETKRLRQGAAKLNHSPQTTDSVSPAKQTHNAAEKVFSHNLTSVVFNNGRRLELPSARHLPTGRRSNHLRRSIGPSPSSLLVSSRKMSARPNTRVRSFQLGRAFGLRTRPRG